MNQASYLLSQLNIRFYLNEHDFRNFIRMNQSIAFCKTGHLLSQLNNFQEDVLN